MPTIGKMSALLAAKYDGSGFAKARADIAALHRDMARQATATSGGGLGSIVSAVTPFRLGMAGIAAGMAAAAVGSVRLAADMERTATSFKLLIGDSQVATRVLNDLRTFADKTPFEFPELRDAARNLAAFGFGAQELMPVIQRLGNLSAALNVPIGEIAEVYGKAKVQGRAFARDIHELTNRGIPIIQELAKQFKVADSEVMKLVEAGKVGFPQIEQAIRSLTEEGGKFAGQTEALAKTFEGRWSTMKDAIAAVGREIGENMMVAEEYTGLLKNLPSFLSGDMLAGFLTDPLAGIRDNVGTNAIHAELAKKQADAENAENKARQQQIADELNRLTAPARKLAEIQAAIAAQTKDHSDYIRALQTEAATYGMTADRAEHYKKTLDGLVGEQAEIAARLIDEKYFREQAASVEKFVADIEHEIAALTQTNEQLQAQELLTKNLTEAQRQQVMASLAQLEAAKAKIESDRKAADAAQELIAENKRLADAGKQVFEQTRTPLEQYEAKLRDLFALRELAANDPKLMEALVRAGHAAQDEFAKSFKTPEVTKHEVGIPQAGTAGMISLQRQFLFGEAKAQQKGKSKEELAKITNEILQKILAELKANPDQVGKIGG